MAQHRYRQSKIKREHTIIEGLLPVLEGIAQHPRVQAITPGRINQRSSNRNAAVTFQYKTDSGLKLLARSSAAIQEVFVVTDRPDEVLADLVKLRLVRAPHLRAGNVETQRGSPDGTRGCESAGSSSSNRGDEVPTRGDEVPTAPGAGNEPAKALVPVSRNAKLSGPDDQAAKVPGRSRPRSRGRHKQRDGERPGKRTGDTPQETSGAAADHPGAGAENPSVAAADRGAGAADPGAVGVEKATEARTSARPAGAPPSKRPELADAIDQEIKDQLLEMARQGAGGAPPAPEKRRKKPTYAWRELERTHRELLALSESLPGLD